MDRVTRYPIFSIPHSTRITSLVLDGDVSYPVQLVSVGPEVTGWDYEESPIRSNDHKVQPDTARTGMSHCLHTFSQQLYPEDCKDMKADHTGDAGDTFSKQQWDQQRERRQVIQGQLVKTSGTVAMLQGTAGQGDEVPGPALTQSLEENSVDRKQVDFWAARQQFLNLEQANAGLSGESMSRRVSVSAPPVVNQTPKAFAGSHLANGYGTPIEAQMKTAVVESKKVHGSPVEFPTTEPQSESPEPTKETPIEREIRLAQEREADLREQRGLQRVAGHQELVQITTRPLLTKVSLPSAPRWERGRPSLYVQRDLEQETLREQDHRQQWGRAPTPDWASKSPQLGLRRVLSCDSILDGAPDARAAEPVPEVRRINRIPPDAYQPYLSPGSPSLESPASGAYGKPWGASAKSGGPSADAASPKTTGSQRRVWEPSETSSGTREVPLKPPRGSPRADPCVVKRDQFLLRPLRFGVRDGPQQAEAPQGWGWAGDGGTPALRLHKSPSSELLEREMENVLRREREVAEERRVALFPEVFSPPPPPLDEGSDQDSRSSSRASGITGSYSVSESPLFTPIQLHSGLVWKVESESQSPENSPEEAPWPRRKKELGYAGIDPSDHINSEVLEATRVTRHKNTMAERWEARIYASEDED
ncbi:PREDICTED: mitotic interactor and substrate of PLK1 [Chrysochloris asiatica]|uniref:Mitotic interactor and substrate of PLK1 n=1 Tax=Chrysochloris asiatica TaxID=185453 RepID=A0A9B0X2G9_CHRAS|nr:PREDICTED: mitotic interactor and substrate of PLK1 [Chrysochloris asiatica]